MLLVVGLALNLLFVLFFPQIAADRDMSGDTAFVFQMSLFASWCISVFGAALLKVGKHKAGFILVAIGSLLFVPLGLVAMIGARKLKEKDQGSSLEARREALANADKDAA
ncbi:hypothetical protein [Cobetia crustatorum]|uniref:Uncharacterized protein n=1 Tax=Cobetia crustatorum TaxID=553385 RepID=A0A558HM17_9GAMM|nr:hypothetical protein [Cobetia crustatorum]TVU70184.1 hypothetical protein FQP86_10345 [Cobetia crustatorum]